MTFGIFNLERSCVLHWRGQSLYAALTTAGVEPGRGLPSENGDTTAHRVAVVRLCQIVSLRSTGKRAALFLAHLAAGQSGFWCYQSRRTFHQLNTVFPVPVQLVSWWTGTLVAPQSVNAAIFTTASIYTAFINISTVCQAIEDVAFVTKALETASRVDTKVVTGTVERAFVNVLTSSLIGQQLVAFLAAALKAAHRVSTHMITPPVVETALVNVFAGLAVWLQSEANRTAAADSCH